MDFRHADNPRPFHDMLARRGNPEDGRPPLWNVAVRVVASTGAADGWAAVRRLSGTLEAAGFEVIDDVSTLDVCSADVTVGAFEAEDGTTETELP